MRVAVVGGGVFGTSIGFQLARRGHETTLVERDDVCAGDSARSLAIVRRHYSNESVARLAQRGWEMIRDWADEVGAGDPALTSAGYLVTCPEERLAALQENVRRLRAWGIDTTVVAPDEIAELEPLVSTDGLAAAAWEPDGGYADAERMALSWFAGGVRHGLRALLGTGANTLVTAAGRVVGIETAEGRVDADAVVLAAGCWSAELAATAGVELPLTLVRGQVGRLRQQRGRPQIRVVVSDMASNVLLRPSGGGEAYAVAYRHRETLARRDDLSEVVDPDYRDAVLAALGERVPAYAEADWLGGWAGAYDATPDWNPLLGWAPGVEGLYLACGWSGHGVKLAPAVGEATADLLEGRRPAVDVSELDPGRFERGALLRLAYGGSPRA
jgi:glycine/D-amino acid oxidase-like deaminating enzyme